jgi:hypothetical protein
MVRADLEDFVECYNPENRNTAPSRTSTDNHDVLIATTATDIFVVPSWFIRCCCESRSAYSGSSWSRSASSALSQAD